VQDRQRKQGRADDFKSSNMTGHARNVRQPTLARQSQIRVSKNAYLPCGNGRRKMQVPQ
jgi:hypothetical protein